jgi:hypothetical protein
MSSFTAAMSIASGDTPEGAPMDTSFLSSGPVTWPVLAAFAAALVALGKLYAFRRRAAPARARVTSGEEMKKAVRIVASIAT